MPSGHYKSWRRISFFTSVNIAQQPIAFVRYTPETDELTPAFSGCRVVALRQAPDFFFIVNRIISVPAK